MTYQETQRVAGIFSALLVFGVYFAVVLGMFGDGRFEGPEAASLVGKTILIVIGAAILVHIVVAIHFSIVSSAVMGDDKPSYVVDERDKLIELRGARISEWLTGAGFVASIAALAFGQSVFLVFNLIVGAFALGSVASNAAMLMIYRRGF